MHPNDIHVREASYDDIAALVALNRVAYPTMAEDNVVWAESHLRSHLRVFPQGQLVALRDGVILGSCSSLIVNMGRDPLRPHTWAGITDSGYFTNHDPSGDTLYGADVCVHPDARGAGIGHALYDARRALCRRLNLRRILAGGRLFNYCEHHEAVSPEEYIARVVRGQLSDLVLSFQTREGFQVRGVLSNYLRDRQSMNFASLIEWLNPEHQPPTGGSRKVRVACIQYQMRKIQDFSELARQVTYFVDIAADYRSDFVLLPELFTVQLLSQTETLSPREGIKRLADYTTEVVELIRSLAVRFGVTIIGGSHPVEKEGKLYNVCHVCLPSGQVAVQPKLHITPNERRWWGISGGDHLAVIDTPRAKIGVLICYDVEFPEAARYLADQGAEILFVPFCTDSRQSYLRVRYCAQARAVENQMYVAMAGNVGNLPDVENMDVQYSQSCVLTPSDFAFARDGIHAEADSNEETVLVCDLDLDSLHSSRSGGTVRPRLDRRDDLFQLVTTFQTSLRVPSELREGPLGDQPDLESQE